MRLVPVFLLFVGLFGSQALAAEKDDTVVIQVCESANFLCQQTCILRYPHGQDKTSVNQTIGYEICSGQCSESYDACVAPIEGMTLQTKPQGERNETLDPGPRKKPSNRKPGGGT